MNTIKILYKTKKWDKEIISLTKVDAINLELTSIEKCINRFVNARSLSNNRFPIKDSVSFYFLLSNEYFCLANSHYLIYGDTNRSIEYLYLYVISNIKAYDYFNNGVEITNLAIADEFKKQTFLMRKSTNIKFNLRTVKHILKKSFQQKKMLNLQVHN